MSKDYENAAFRIRDIEFLPNTPVEACTAIFFYELGVQNEFPLYEIKS